MNLHRRILLRLFTRPFLVLALSVVLLVVLKPLSEALSGGPYDAWARSVLSWGIIVMLAGYAVGGVWMMAAMWRFLGWARGDANGDCPHCKSHLKSTANGARRCPLCGYTQGKYNRK